MSQFQIAARNLKFEIFTRLQTAFGILYVAFGLKEITVEIVEIGI
jgi:hypothetical protein